MLLLQKSGRSCLNWYQDFFSVFFYWPPPFPTLQLDHLQAGLYGVTHDSSSPSSPDMRLTGEDCQQACWEGGFSVDRVEP